MKTICIKIIIFSFVVFLISVLCLLIVFKVINVGDNFKIDKKRTNIVLGHSHTECAFNDTIIKNTLNLSNGGESCFYTYFKLKKVIENNHSIKNIFLSFSNNQIDIYSDMGTIWTDKYMNKWYPKYGAFMDYAAMKVLINNNPKSFLNVQPLAIKDYLTFLIKNDKSIILSQSWGKYNYLKTNKINSKFKILDEKTTTTIITTTKNFKYSKINLQYLEKCIQLCKEKNIKIYLVRCPVDEKWMGLKNEYFFQEYLKKNMQNVNFLDFKNFPLDKSFFADEHHLNGKGSTKFSLFFNNLLEKGLLSKTNKQEFINQEMKKQF